MSILGVFLETPSPSLLTSILAKWSSRAKYEKMPVGPPGKQHAIW